MVGFVKNVYLESVFMKLERREMQDIIEDINFVTFISLRVNHLIESTELRYQIIDTIKQHVCTQIWQNLKVLFEVATQTQQR